MKTFQQLQAQWYRKLKRAGFKDLETSKGQLKVYDSFYFQSAYSPVAFKAREKYFQLASHLLHTHKFKSERQKRIWQLHCEGKEQSIIAQRVGVSQPRVSGVLSELAEMLKAKE